VDGNGLTRIEDREVALALLNKVNKLNDRIAFSSLLPVLVFAALPHEVVSTMTWLGVVFTGKGKKLMKPNSMLFQILKYFSFTSYSQVNSYLYPCTLCSII